MKRALVLSIVFLLILGCQQEAVTGYVGQQFLLKADVPNEVGTFDYIWKITDLPEASKLTLADMQFSEDESQAIFIPDVAGHYTLQVTVWKYTDKLGAIAYTYDITEQEIDTETVNTDAWLNESVDETKEEQQEIAEKPDSAITEEKKINNTVDTETETLETSTAPPPPIVTTEANFTIQVAAESNKDAAQRIVDKFKMAGFDAYIQEVTTASDQTLFRIRIGRYATQEAARTDAQRLELEYGTDTWITNIR